MGWSEEPRLLWHGPLNCFVLCVQRARNNLIAPPLGSLCICQIERGNDKDRADCETSVKTGAGDVIEAGMAYQYDSQVIKGEREDRHKHGRCLRIGEKTQSLHIPHPPSSVLITDELVEHKANNTPRQVVERCCWRNLARATKDDWS